MPVSFGGDGFRANVLRTDRGMNKDLTPRERQIMVLVTEGKYNKEIAKALGISVETIKTHRKRAYKKLGAHNAVQAVTAFLGRGGLKE